MTKPVFFDRTLYVVANEDGDLTADVDLETAIERMETDYGGERDTYRVVEFELKAPRPGDFMTKILATLPDEVRARVEFDLST